MTDLLDVLCYGCGTPRRLDTPVGDALDSEGPCAYCGADVFVFARAEQRRRLRQLSDEFWWSKSDDPESLDEGIELETADGEESVETADEDYLGDDPDLFGMWPTVPPSIIIDSVPMGFGVSFKHEPFLGRVMAESPDPPGLNSRDERHGRRSAAVGKQYAERLKAELEEVAPSLDVQTHPRHPGETGGPISYDLVILVLAGVAAYPASKELIKDVSNQVRRITRRLTDLTNGERPVVSEGVAFLFARDALAERFGIIDSRLVATSVVLRQVDWIEIDGFLVHLQADETLYVISLDRFGDFLDAQAIPLPSFPGRAEGLARDPSIEDGKRVVPPLSS